MGNVEQINMKKIKSPRNLKKDTSRRKTLSKDKFNLWYFNYSYRFTYRYHWSIKFCSSFCCFSIKESTSELRKELNAGPIVELPSSMHVFWTFMFGAAFSVFGFFYLVDPDRCWAKATHCWTGIFNALGNF